MTCSSIEFPASGKQARGVIPGPAGALELAVASPKAQARGLIMVAHPHPQHGGTLDNKVTYMIARAVVEAGFVAVRPNYRGIGESDGTYDQGRGELEDLRAARHWALAESGLSESGLAGFSFGAWLALELATTDGAPALLTVGLPAEYFNGQLPRPSAAWRAIYGDADDVIDVTNAIASVRTLRPEVDLKIMAGAGHFLHGRLSELRRLAGDHFDANYD